MRAAAGAAVRAGKAHDAHRALERLLAAVAERRERLRLVRVFDVLLAAAPPERFFPGKCYLTGKTPSLRAWYSGGFILMWYTHSPQVLITIQELFYEY